MLPFSRDNIEQDQVFLSRWLVSSQSNLNEIGKRASTDASVDTKGSTADTSECSQSFDDTISEVSCELGICFALQLSVSDFAEAEFHSSATIGSLESLHEHQAYSTTCSTNHKKQETEDRSTFTFEQQLAHGVAAMQASKFQSAVAFFERASDETNGVPRGERIPLRRARALHLVSLAASQLKDLDLAHNAAQESYLIRLQSYGPLHIDTIASFSNLGYIYIELNEVGKAAWCLAQVLKALRAVFGYEHESVGTTATTLAAIYLRLERPEQAKRCYLYALETYRALGWDKTRDGLEEELYKLGLSETRVDL